jgi:hypothetical protein
MGFDGKPICGAPPARSLGVSWLEGVLKWLPSGANGRIRLVDEIAARADDRSKASATPFQERVGGPVDRAENLDYARKIYARRIGGQVNFGMVSGTGELFLR